MNYNKRGVANLGFSKQVRDLPQEVVQHLFCTYSTLKTEDEIYEGIVSTIGSEVFDWLPELNPRQIVNKIVMDNYHNEAAIKAAFIKKVLLRGNSHVTIFEFPLRFSRADLCKVNGKSMAFEIKTDLDNLCRLDHQIAEYAQAFEFVYVICSSKRVQELLCHIPESCGVYSYTFQRGRYTFCLERKASQSCNLCSTVQLSLMTKDYLGELSGISRTAPRSKHEEAILKSCDAKSINRKFKHYLKQKYANQWMFLKDHIDTILEVDYQWFFKNTMDPAIIYT